MQLPFYDLRAKAHREAGRLFTAARLDVHVQPPIWREAKEEGLPEPNAGMLRYSTPPLSSTNTNIDWLAFGSEVSLQ